MYIPLPLPHLLNRRQANPFVSPTPPAANPTGQPADPLTTDAIIGIGVAGATIILILIVLSVREVRRRRRVRERKRRREMGLPPLPVKPRGRWPWDRLFKRRAPQRPAVQIPRANDESALKQPLTAHTKHQSVDSLTNISQTKHQSVDSLSVPHPATRPKHASLDSQSTTAPLRPNAHARTTSTSTSVTPPLSKSPPPPTGTSKEQKKLSIDSAFAAPPVSPDPAGFRGHLRAVHVPPPSQLQLKRSSSTASKGSRKLRKRNPSFHSASSPPLQATEGEKGATLPNVQVAPEPVALPTGMPVQWPVQLPWITTPFDPNLERPPSASSQPAPAPALGAGAGLGTGRQVLALPAPPPALTADSVVPAALLPGSGPAAATLPGATALRGTAAAGGAAVGEVAGPVIPTRPTTVFDPIAHRTHMHRFSQFFHGSSPSLSSPSSQQTQQGESPPVPAVLQKRSSAQARAAKQQQQFTFPPYPQPTPEEAHISPINSQPHSPTISNSPAYSNQWTYPSPSPAPSDPDPDPDPLLQPGQRLSFVFDELTRRTVVVPFVPELPDELAVRVGEEVVVVECFDDGWSVVRRLPSSKPAHHTGTVNPARFSHLASPAGLAPPPDESNQEDRAKTEGWEEEVEEDEEEEEGVIPTACWAGLPRNELVSKPMRYSSLRHGVESGVFEIGTAL